MIERPERPVRPETPPDAKPEYPERPPMLDQSFPENRPRDQFGCPIPTKYETEQQAILNQRIARESSMYDRDDR